MPTKIIFESEKVAFLFMPSFEDFVASQEGAEESLVRNYLNLCLENHDVQAMDSVPVYLFEGVKRGLSYVVIRNALGNTDARLNAVQTFLYGGVAVMEKAG